MRLFGKVLTLSLAVTAAVWGVHAFAAGRNASAKEDYVRAPMPPGFQVIVTELEGPVFADAKGRTFYKWPRYALRNGDAGEVEFKPTCDGNAYRENSGLMSPYPPGLELPDVDKRPACTDVWPPVLATADAKAVGKWTIVDRPDGRKQWAYDGWSLYTSVLDKNPGDVYGATALPDASGAMRKPVQPESTLPSQFLVFTTMYGRSIELHEQWSVYSYDGDARNKSNCYNSCLDGWQPILAAAYAKPVGEWTTFERAPGVRQWAFRGMPLYRYLADRKIHGMDGADIPGWHNVYTQTAPEAPKAFALKDTTIGVVLGDAQGKTIYKYVCSDDAVDQLACDNPDSPQVYRFTVCGGGDVERCLKTFPYVIAPVGAKTGNQVWGTMYINPKTGKRANANDAGALHVWTFRDRPVYTFAGRNDYGDKKPTDINAHDWGEFNGRRNGYAALIYRDVFSFEYE